MTDETSPWYKGVLRHSFGSAQTGHPVAYKFLGTTRYGPTWALKFKGAKGFNQVTQEYAGKNCMGLLLGKVLLNDASQKLGDRRLTQWLAAHNALKADKTTKPSRKTRKNP
jgi:hypothetical protein